MSKSQGSASPAPCISLLAVVDVIIFDRCTCRIKSPRYPVELA